jgi:hypothetical protein
MRQNRPGSRPFFEKALGEPLRSAPPPRWDRDRR